MDGGQPGHDRVPRMPDGWPNFYGPRSNHFARARDQWVVARGAFFWGAIPLRVRLSRPQRSSALLAVGSCIGVYVILAFAFHWLIEPAVATSRDAAASLPPAATVAPDAQFAAFARARAELPSPSPTRQAIKPPASAAVVAAASDPVENAPVGEAKKAPRKPVARSTAGNERSRGERGNPIDFAAGLFGGQRRWF